MKHGTWQTSSAWPAKGGFLTRLHQPVLLILSTALVNLFVIVACPNITGPPPVAVQRSTLVLNFLICCAPLLWSAFLIAAKRTHTALSVAIINLVPATIWLSYAIPLLATTLK
ncbi:MAG: hypothetical protein C5B50_15405 [Verrucomicrobia bacterium]|nr:MAG: hypothetical protein C5B50_15405 [Verrucomicrobiota bacterium]